MTAPINYAGLPRAGLGRRLGAACYDLLLAMAVYIFAGFIGFGLFALFANVGWVYVAPEQTFATALRQQALYHGLYQLWLWGWVVAFYSYFWSQAGQTLGMQAWRLRLQYPDGQNLRWITALARCCWSLLGAGNLLLLFSQRQLALQDLLTGSEMVLLPKTVKNSTSL